MQLYDENIPQRFAMNVFKALKRCAGNDKLSAKEVLLGKQIYERLNNTILFIFHRFSQKISRQINYRNTRMVTSLFDAQAKKPVVVGHQEIKRVTSAQYVQKTGNPSNQT